jgi:HEPN domain-containing protein
MPSRHADWISQAERDLAHAQHALEDQDFEWACFAARQASDRALKAVFQSIGARVIVGHSLRDLMMEFKRSQDVPEELVEAARVLDRHYIPTRYPDAHPSGAPYQYYTEKEAAEAIRYASEIIGFCKGRLPRPPQGP